MIIIVINVPRIEPSENKEKEFFNKSLPMKLVKDVFLIWIRNLCIVANIAVVKPEKAEKLEILLIQVSIRMINGFIRMLKEACCKVKLVKLSWLDYWNKLMKRKSNQQQLLRYHKILLMLISSKERDLMMMMMTWTP